MRTKLDLEPTHFHKPMSKGAKILRACIWTIVGIAMLLYLGVQMEWWHDF